MSEKIIKVATPEKPENIEVRRAEAGDLDSITSLALAFEQELREERGEAPTDMESEKEKLRSIYSDRLSNMVVQGLRNFIFLAIDTSKNKPVGFIVGHVPDPKPEGSFYALRRGRYVLPEYREKGISRQLAQEFNSAVKSYGASHIEFEVQEGGKGHNFLTKDATFLKYIPEENGRRRLRFSANLGD